MSGRAAVIDLGSLAVRLHIAEPHRESAPGDPDAPFRSLHEARRISRLAEGLAPGQSTVLTNDEGQEIRVTATLALHGLAEAVRKATGDVTGFVLEWEGQDGVLYITGDTVWFDDIVEVGRQFDVGAVILHMGAAKVPAAGDNALTMTSDEGARLTKALDAHVALAAHFEGWAHYTDFSRERMARVFDEAGVGDRLQLIALGETINLEPIAAPAA